MLEYEDDEFVAVPKDSYKIAAGLNPDYDGSIPVRSTRSQNNGETSLFVGNLPFEFTDEQLQSLFFKYGTIKNSFIVTRKMKSEEDRMVSKGCGYVVFSNSDDAAKAMTELNEHEIGGRKIYVSIAKDSHKKHSVKKESKQPTAPSYTVYGLMVLVENLPDDITAKYLFKRWKRIDGFHKLIHPCPEPKAARVIFKTYDSAKNGVLKLNDHIIKGSKVTAKLFGSKANRLIVRNLPFDCSEEDIKTHFSSIGSVKEITFPKQVTGSSRGFAFIWYSSIFDSLKAVEKLNFSELKGRKIAVDWAASKTDYTKKENESDTKSKPSSIDKDEVSNSGQDVDDHESSDVEDPAAESDVMDVESNSDDEPEEDAEKEIDEAIRKEKIRNGSKDIQEGRTVFIRHIPLDANENDLRKAFSRFGKILKVSLVYKKIDDESKIGTGSGFVQFESKESVDSAIAAARVSLDGRTRAKSSKIRTSSFAQALACEGVGGIWIGGKFLDVSRAISRDNAVKVVHDRENADKEDKRNLYLAKEGLITSESPIAEELSKSDLDRRIALWKETKEKLRNSNYTVSKTRLSVHNLPLDLEEQRLMQLFSTSTTDEGTKASRKLKQVKIVRDMNRLDKSGKPRSKRFGFVEFHKHEDALDALRALNNNPSIFGNSQRPIVSFALEDMRKLHVRQLKRKHAIENAKKPVKDSSKQEKGAKHKNNSHKRRKTQN